MASCTWGCADYGVIKGAGFPSRERGMAQFTIVSSRHMALNFTDHLASSRNSLDAIMATEASRYSDFIVAKCNVCNKFRRAVADIASVSRWHVLIGLTNDWTN